MLPAQKRCITIEHYCSTILLLYTTIEPHAESRAHWSVWPPEVTDTGGAYRFVAIWPYLVRVRRRLWFRVKLELTLGPRHMLGGQMSCIRVVSAAVSGTCRRRSGTLQFTDVTEIRRPRHRPTGIRPVSSSSSSPTPPARPCKWNRT